MYLIRKNHQSDRDLMGYHGILWDIIGNRMPCIHVSKILEVCNAMPWNVMCLQGCKSMCLPLANFRIPWLGDSWWDRSFDCNHICLPSRKFEEEKLRVKVLPTL